MIGDLELAESRIRGEEIMLRDENLKVQEERKLKKTLDDAEIERRLTALRKKMGL